MTDTTAKIGTLLDGSEPRDAIHVAVLPATAGERLCAGDHVAIVNGRITRSGQRIGIVDPFIKFPIEEGMQVYVFLYPGTITSLRHDWTHPAVQDALTPSVQGAEPPITTDKVVALAISTAWLMKFCVDNRLGYGDAREAFDRLLRGTIYGTSSLELDDEFWHHYEVVTGQPTEDRDMHFHCSC